MEHIKIEGLLINENGQTSQATEELIEKVQQVLNEHDKLVAEREGLWYALLRAEQTFRNLASDGSIVTMGTSLEIARNELENMRDALKLGKTE